MCSALDVLLSPGCEVALFLPDASADGRAMTELLAHHPDDARVTAVVRSAQPDDSIKRLIPLTNGRRATDGRPTAHVCRQSTCHEPVYSAGALAQLLEIKEDSASRLLDTQARPK
jgi:uncharacterized protein YyaL (SSP411 family)